MRRLVFIVRIQGVKRMNEREESKTADSAILLGIDFGNGDEEASLDELESLAQTAGIETYAKALQRRDKIEASTYMGTGKLRQIKELCEGSGVNIAIVDDELKGSQVREIEKILDMRVIDRTTLILDIFASRAKSTEGRLQVELAQYKYRLPRLRGFGDALSRLGGGIGTRGPGETKLETDRRHIRRRIEHIEKQLAETSVRREMSRTNRKKNNVPTVALVGYTNAGKSSLMNRLCPNAEVYVQDQLFATLDPTTRRVPLGENLEVLLTDTVGFVRKLPHSLVEAFKSTLEEAVLADFLLLVLDISPGQLDAQWETTLSVLKELGADEKKIIVVFNKLDLLDRDAELVLLARLNGLFPGAYYISTHTGEGVDALKARLTAIAAENFQLLRVKLPPGRHDLAALAHASGRIYEERYDEAGELELVFTIGPVHRHKFLEYTI